jgi:hypothetical protein
VTLVTSLFAVSVPLPASYAEPDGTHRTGMWAKTTHPVSRRPYVVPEALVMAWVLPVLAGLPEAGRAIGTKCTGGFARLVCPARSPVPGS